MSKVRGLVFYSWGAEPFFETEEVYRSIGFDSTMCPSKQCVASFATLLWDDSLRRFRYEVGLMFSVYTPLTILSITAIANVMWMLEEHVEIAVVKCINPANGHVVVAGIPKPNTRVVDELIDMATTRIISIDGRSIDYCKLADKIIL